MKIAHITTSLIHGGSEAVMYRLIRSSTENTHFVISLTGTGHYARLLREAGIEVFCLQFKGVGVPIKPLFEMRKILKAEKPDIVQTWMYHANFFGGIVAHSLRIRSVFWNLRTSNPKLGNYGKKTEWLNKISARLAYVIPVRIISCAHKATSVHIELGYPHNKMQTICNGYDMTYLDFSRENRDKFRHQWQIPENTLLIGMVGRWHIQKNHQLLFRSLDKIRFSITQSWKLILVGPDINADNKELVQQLTESRLLDDCILAGPQQDIPTVMSALDIHALSSTVEGFPNVIAEAMACCTPCVSTDVGDAAFIIGDTGWVSPIQEIEGFSHNLIRAFETFSDKKNWDSLAKQSRRRIKNEFSIESMTTQYQDAWRQFASRRN